MKYKALPSTDRLNELFVYNPSTGVIVRKIKISNSKAGDVLNTPNGYGYFQVYIGGVNYLVHRIAWKMHYGEDPIKGIDHINGDGKDNRIENLRVVSQKENLRNSRMRSDNKTGVTGVRWREDKKKWHAFIKGEDKLVSLGHYGDFSSAVEARLAAESVYGYHPNHGGINEK